MPSPQEIVIRSWAHLQDALFQGGLDEHVGKLRCPYVFRGLGRATYRLTTSLNRLGAGFREVEGPLLRAFQKYAHRNAVERESVWHWLSLAQHHGLPTRLLDWTFSPLVAAHFATASPQHARRDGVVWAIRYDLAHRQLPPPLRGKLDGAKAHIFTVEMLSQVVASLEELEKLARHEYALFFEPPSMDDRIVNQYALFSLMSDSGLVFSDWLQKYPDVYRKYVIPPKVKAEIRDRLDLANITERVLFPGLDGLSTWLKRYYSPRERETAHERGKRQALARSRGLDDPRSMD